MRAQPSIDGFWLFGSAAEISGFEEGSWSLLDLLEPPAWHREAACRGTDPNLFFPERGEATGPAKAVCRGCTVRDECREAGMGEKQGIWGGLSERERRVVRRNRRNAA